MVLSSQCQFSGHETFPLRYPWLKKGYDAVLSDGLVFTRDDAITTLGVGKNMVRAIRHWCLVAGVLEEGDKEGLRPSDLGKRIFGDDGLDPYLEDHASLWLIHWKIATNRSRATTWFWTFSYFHEPEFTRESLASSIMNWTLSLPGKPVAESSIKRDVEVFIRTYLPARHGKCDLVEDSLDCPLRELGLIVQTMGSQLYRFRRGLQQELPDGIFLYAVLEFWSKFAPTAETIAIQDLARQPGSPGRIFKIDESTMVERLEGIEKLTNGAVLFGETAGVRQLYRRQRLKPQDLLPEAFAIGVRR